jgi:hypothetical protein
MSLFILGLILLILAFFGSNVEFPGWWMSVMESYHSSFSWWPVVNGLPPETHYSARVYFTIAIGLVIFLPQVETTFVSLMRRRSPIGAPYVDRRHFTCPVCGAINRPSVQFCVKCGSQISSGTRYWERQSGGQSSFSVLKSLLGIVSLLAIFLGLFDLTIYSAMTNYLGTDPAVVFLGTTLSIIPSIAAYVALKEGPFRKYASLKQFDKLVLEDRVWIVLGLFFVLLVLGSMFSGNLVIFPSTVVIVAMQLFLCIFFVFYPTLRRRIARVRPQTPFEDTGLW